MPRHVHHDYVFSLAVKGATEIDCGHCGSTHIHNEGDLLLTEAHEVYAGRALGKPPWHTYTISISKDKLASLLDIAADGKQITLPHYSTGSVRNDTLRRLFLKLHESFASQGSQLEQESVLIDWVVSVQQTYALDSRSLPDRRLYSETESVARVRNFIVEKFAKNLRLGDLAEVARLSPFHLNRVFSAEVGLPPHAFQNQLRIEKARSLIGQKKSLSEIALETGFSDQSHFNRFFKRYTGVTPKRFFTE